MYTYKSLLTCYISHYGGRILAVVEKTFFFKFSEFSKKDFIIGQFSVPVKSENLRKPLVFSCFQGV